MLTSVIKPPITNNAAFAGNNGKGSHLSWVSDLPLMTKNVITPEGSLLQDPNIDFVTDYLSTTRYTSLTPGGLQLQFTEEGALPVTVNHVAMGGVNFASGDVISVEIYLKGTGSYVLEKSFDTSSRKSFYDNKPFMIILDNIYDAFGIRVKFITGQAQSQNVSVATIYAGKTLEFPNQPAIGFKKGSWNTDDEPRNSRRQNNSFGASTVKRQGTTENVTIPVVPSEFMDTEWTEFVRLYEYVPVFFSWDTLNFPLDVIYGNMKFNDSNYSSSLYSQISFNVKGIV
jgi:hypothetical protein